MIEDEILKYQYKRGSSDALARIYQKYADYLLTLAIALLNDVNTAEDVLHDVFVKFAASVDKFKIRGNLKSYLATCIVNRCRDEIRSRTKKPDRIENIETMVNYEPGPYERVSSSENSKFINQVLSKLPYEQREAVVLRIKAGLRLTKIAELQQVSPNTARGRYRYGIEKLRSVLNGEHEK